MKTEETTKTIEPEKKHQKHMKTITIINENDTKKHKTSTKKQK